ncbi:MAG: RagB/SusD family nutrient uptake outer membrane protein [Candidatus Pseudobacter hemicellulosilyticus]|uniref:RagB/SusD family nutrient uptake outer membrane protein n=1 Tax=Candidatus Pseudobacter hemicellulosilyticus TaxID=3121375 RepID=A0AAJ6BG39_9BACT|nr:MAG: RagB/SusD family nutrient uptake outer membrane protein [Pseudobacter sp.]
MNRFNIVNKYNLALLILLFSTAGCRKLVEVEGPPTGVSSGNVYNSDATAAAVLTGMYINISTAGQTTGIPALNYLTALSADELTLYSASTNTTQIAYYQNNLNPGNVSNNHFWNWLYPVIYKANDAVEGLTGNTALSPAASRQLLGEALFMRAFCYFYLVNLYGNVPLITGTDYTQNAITPRTPKEKVYAQIIVDLTEAQQLLSDLYLSPAMQETEDRVRPTRWAATALLARTYLFTGDWSNAEKEAGKVIDHTPLFQPGSLDDIFLKNSTEAIWQIQPVLPGWNTNEASFYVLTEAGPNYNTPSYLSEALLLSFEDDDDRLEHWAGKAEVDMGGSTITYHYPYKYKVYEYGSPVTEYEMVLRLGEQFLIRAEARAQLEDISGAQEDLNLIRNRAGLGSTTATTKEDLLTAILHERQVELFVEWGSRWLDLKRTGQAAIVMPAITAAKGGSWTSSQQLYPVPLTEIQRNPYLVPNP